MSGSLSVATLNVRGLSTRRKQSQVYRLLTEQDIDVVAVQETKVEGEEETEAMVRRFTSRYYACVSHAVGISAGCVLLLKKLPGLVVEGVTSCRSGRLVVCDCSLDNVNFRIVCVYAPNAVIEREKFFGTLRQHVDTDRMLIITGDFNCVLSGRDKTSNNAYRNASTNLLSEIVADYGLVDVGQCLDGEKDVRFTHFQGFSHARLDRIYVSLDLIQKCQSYDVHAVSFSDHCLVKCTIGGKKEESPFTWDLWKLNSKLLEDETFTTFVRKKTAELDGTHSDIGALWELSKQEIKIKAIQRCSCIKYEETKKERMLRNILQKLTLEEGRMPGVFKDDIAQIKHKLELIDEERYRGALVRARAEQWAVGEAPTKRALGIEKAHARRNQIKEITYMGKVTSEKSEIDNAFYEYYQALFALKAVDAESFKRDFIDGLPRLEDEMKDWLERPISEDEVKCAIESLNPGKSPGPDGLSAAFYKMFKYEMVPVLTKLFNAAYDLKTLPPSYSTSHTVLIPKTDEAEKLKFVKSYRPISLTNVDYKIFMKVLAQRLQSVVQQIVGPHQTCGIKGRNIFTNIHKARCVLECCDALHTGVAVLQIDLEKAFDCVSHEILFCILDHVNVGFVIKEGVALAYRNCTTRLIVNKKLGAPIEVQRSVRQGCPLSPLLFCIYIEALCMSIIRNSAIEGFRLHESEVKLLAYADDVAVFCMNEESVQLVVDTVKKFGMVTGSFVNWAKCLGFWHGEWSSTPPTFANISWVTTPVKYLGVELEYYRDSEPYWRSQTMALREKAEKWKGARLSIFARATACNLFFVAKIWYIMQVLHCSRINVQRLHRVFAVFVWGSTWERCSRTNLFRRVRDGGLGLAHLYVRQLVNRFLFWRDVRDPFLQSVMQVRLARAMPEYVVSTWCMPGGVYGYFKEIVMTARFLFARFSGEYLSSVTRKKLYKDICDVVFPVPMYRYNYRAGPGQNVLKRVKRMEVHSGVKTFFFKLHTGTLSVGTWMQDRGISVPWGTQCSICKQPETIEHVFLHCWAAVFLWDVLQRTLHKDFPLSPHGIRYLAVENEEGAPLDLVMLVALHSIWRSRMAWLHGDVDARPTRQCFRESISQYVEVQKRKAYTPEWLSRIEPLTMLREF